jgi:hypothetical protein
MSPTCLEAVTIILRARGVDLISDDTALARPSRSPRVLGYAEKAGAIARAIPLPAVHRRPLPAIFPVMCISISSPVTAAPQSP